VHEQIIRTEIMKIGDYFSTVMIPAAGRLIEGGSL